MAKHSARVSSVVSLLLVISTCAVAQNATGRPARKAGSLPQSLAKKIDAVIEEQRAKLGIPGISVAVATDGHLSYSKGFGMADLENSVRTGVNTVYRTASIAKPLTATAVMQLAEQGKLDLDAPIQKYCPAFPEKQWPVTARQLLGHLGGVRHYKASGESNGTTYYYTIEDSLRIFKDEPLLHEPGTKFNYTTYGYSVLGCAIEGASGARYEDYMREHVFGAAKMERTRIDNHRFIIPDRTRGYMRLDQTTHALLPAFLKAQVKVGQIFNAPLHDTSMKVPGGGLVSTAPDLVSFGLSMMNGLLVKPSTRDQMWTAQKLRDGSPTSYGLGWGVGEVPGMKGVALYSHSGGQAGTSTMLYLIPGKNLVIAGMCNLQGADVGRVLNEIGKLLLAESKP
ncbi:MAG TPA: serine hydrolase domain-containing protein [Blastocatellia bacterium]|nr:serine hydrolase domain-containing protein [Blastocatellia bacterium]